MIHPEADSTIESGRPLKAVFPLFQTKVAAYEYFARSMTQRFSSPDSNCVMCGCDSDSPPVRFTWRANIHTTKTVVMSFLFTVIALFAAHLYSRWVVVEFATFHRLCLQCRRRHRVRRIVVGVLNNLLFAVLILILLLTVPAIIFTIAAPFIEPRGTWLMLSGVIVGVGLLALVISGFEKCRTLIIPRSVRHIGRAPFFLHALSTTA